MKVDKKELTATLEKVAPALHSKDLLEALCCLWFDGQRVSAYNDEIGIETPLETEFKGGVRGAVVMGLLTNSSAKTAEFKADGENLTLQAAGMKVDLSLLPPDRRIDWLPKMPKKGVELTKEFLAALRSSLLSISSDASRPDQLGVTIELEEASEKDAAAGQGPLLNFYTTDNRSICWTTCDAPEGWPVDRLCIKRIFVDQLLSRAKAGTELMFTEHGLIVQGTDDTVMLGRLMDIERPIRFAESIAEILPKGYHKKLIEIPGRFGMMLARAKVLLTNDPNDSVRIQSEGGPEMQIVTKSQLGAMDDVLSVEGDLSEVNVQVDPELILRGLEHTERMLVTPSAVIMVGEGLVYLISTR